MLLVVLLAALLLVGVLASLLSRHVTRASHLVILAATAAASPTSVRWSG